MRARQIAGSVAVCAMAAALVGCAATSAPDGWPHAVRGALIGKCPDISGKYLNAGVRHPPQAPAISLTDLLGLEHADHVEIVQGADTISATGWSRNQAGQRLVFTSGEVGAGWDMHRPGTFSCPLDVPSGRVLSLGHLENGGTQFLSGAGGLLVFRINACRIGKVADGSLVVRMQTGTAALLGPLPAGHVDLVWYRFAPAKP